MVLLAGGGADWFDHWTCGGPALHCSATLGRTFEEAVEASGRQDAVQGSWMSRAELEDLREQLSSLRIRVFAQEERIESLEEQVRERGLEDRGLEDRGREARVLDSPEPRGVASLSEAGGVSLGSYSVVPNPRRENCGNNDISSEDTAARLQLAQECGRFLRRALEGDFRGTSGRSRLSWLQQCTLWLQTTKGGSLSLFGF